MVRLGVFFVLILHFLFSRSGTSEPNWLVGGWIFWACFAFAFECCGTFDEWGYFWHVTCVAYFAFACLTFAFCMFCICILKIFGMFWVLHFACFACFDEWGYFWHEWGWGYFVHVLHVWNIWRMVRRGMFWLLFIRQNLFCLLFARHLIVCLFVCLFVFCTLWNICRVRVGVPITADSPVTHRDTSHHGTTFIILMMLYQFKFRNLSKFE